MTAKESTEEGPRAPGTGFTRKAMMGMKGIRPPRSAPSATGEDRVPAPAHGKRRCFVCPRCARLPVSSSGPPLFP